MTWSPAKAAGQSSLNPAFQRTPLRSASLGLMCVLYLGFISVLACDPGVHHFLSTRLTEVPTASHKDTGHLNRLCLIDAVG